MPKITQIGRELRDAINRNYGKTVSGEICSAITRLAATLHTQAEATCSYAWANTREYQRRCDLAEARVPKLARELREVGLTLTYQGDPRGLALKLHPVGLDPDTRWASEGVGQVALY